MISKRIHLELRILCEYILWSFFPPPPPHFLNPFTWPLKMRKYMWRTFLISDLCEDTEKDSDGKHSSSGFLLHPAAWTFLLSCETSWIPLSICVSKRLVSTSFIYTPTPLMSRTDSANRIWTWIKNSFNSSFFMPFFPLRPLWSAASDPGRTPTENTHSVQKKKTVKSVKRVWCRV